MKTLALSFVAWSLFGPFLFAAIGPRLQSMRHRTMFFWIALCGPTIWIAIGIIMWKFRKRVP